MIENDGNFKRECLARHVYNLDLTDLPGIVSWIKNRNGVGELLADLKVTRNATLMTTDIFQSVGKILHCPMEMF
jgi:hypothetical protein